ncbi:hypothetical protein [Bifidobacterium sp. SO1]|uniref:hypothetical protein n=1 Tax=Bifidobacterium sp. SO1 TaxID=2809029 RepID=UPI001BDDB939|nr:hypothetical protein [Bifidobacterium sp. SO1]MBT1161696.1 hypothetical protein [Bifidobacterium sp. SO1]
MGIFERLRRKSALRKALTLDEASERIGIAPHLLRHAVDIGDLPILSSTPLLFDRESLDSYGEHVRQRQKATSDLLSLVEEQEHGWPDPSIS